MSDFWSIEHRGCQFIIALHQSWLYLSTGHEQIWLRVEEQPPERPRHTIQDPKTMANITWNLLGFHLLDALPKGNTFNNKYYRVNILTELFPLRPQVDGKRLVIHADNAIPHTTRKCRAFCRDNRLPSPYTHRTRPVSDHPSSFALDDQALSAGNHFSIT
jgi:hypothetical protein